MEDGQRDRHTGGLGLGLGEKERRKRIRRGGVCVKGLGISVPKVSLDWKVFWGGGEESV